jgi:hypothetical protein
LVWFEHEVTIDQNAHRETRTDGQGRLDVDLALHDLLADVLRGALGALADGGGDLALLARRSQVRADAE